METCKITYNLYNNYQWHFTLLFYPLFPVYLHTTNTYKYTPTSQAVHLFALTVSTNCLSDFCYPRSGVHFLFCDLLSFSTCSLAVRLVAPLPGCLVELLLILLMNTYYLKPLTDLYLVLSTFSDVLEFIIRLF